MILVIDTNILLASLIRDSTIRKIIVESDWEFFYPEVSFHEVRKYHKNPLTVVHLALKCEV